MIITYGRSIFEALSLAIILLIYRHSIRVNSLKDAIAMIIAGGLQAAQWYFFFEAVKVSNVAVAILSLFTFPVFIALLEPLFFKEKYRLKSMVFALFIFLGVFFIVPDINLENKITLGAVWGLTSALLTAFLLLLTRRYMKTYSALSFSFYKSAVASLFMIPFLYPFDIEFRQNEIFLIAALGILFTALPYYMITRTLKKLNAALVSRVISLEPVYNIVLAYLFLKEIPNVMTFLGGAIILTVSFISTLEKQE